MRSIYVHLYTKLNTTSNLDTDIMHLKSRLIEVYTKTISNPFLEILTKHNDLKIHWNRHLNDLNDGFGFDFGQESPKNKVM